MEKENENELMQYSKDTALGRFNATLFNHKMQNYISDALKDESIRNSFINNLTALVSNNSNLQNCEPSSIIFASLQATTLDLPLNNSLGYCYIIPYKNNAQFQIGYKGLIQLAMRTNEYVNINVTDIREGEILKNNRLTGEIEFKFVDEATRDNLQIIGYAGYFKLRNGFEKIIYWDLKKIAAHGKKYSKTYNNGQWNNNFEVMAVKTILKQLLTKWGILSIEIQQVNQIDQAVFYEDGSFKYSDNLNSVDKENALSVLDVFVDKDLSADEFENLSAEDKLSYQNYLDQELEIV
jgi:recombination protein RecT